MCNHGTDEHATSDRGLLPGDDKPDASAWHYCPTCGRGMLSTPRGRALEESDCSSHEKRLVLRRINGEADEVIDLTDGAVKIGKLKDCDVKLNDFYTSRTHACIERRDGQAVIHDLSSANGTYLRIKTAAILQPGDEFVVGKNVFRLEAHPGKGQ